MKNVFLLPTWAKWSIGILMLLTILLLSFALTGDGQFAGN